MIITYKVTTSKDFYRFNEQTGEIDHQEREISYQQKHYVEETHWKILRWIGFLLILGISWLTSVFIAAMTSNKNISIGVLIATMFLGWLLVSLSCLNHNTQQGFCDTYNRVEFLKATVQYTKDGWHTNKKTAEQERVEYIDAFLALKANKENK